MLSFRCPCGDGLGELRQGGVYYVGWSTELVAQLACVLDGCQVPYVGEVLSEYVAELSCKDCIAI